MPTATAALKKHFQSATHGVDRIRLGGAIGECLFVAVVGESHQPTENLALAPQLQDQLRPSSQRIINVGHRLDRVVIEAEPCPTFDRPTSGEIYLEDQVYQLSELEGVMRKKLEPYGEAPTIRLNADKDLNMDEVFTILNIAKRNRYKVILGTQPSN